VLIKLGGIGLDWIGWNWDWDWGDKRGGSVDGTKAPYPSLPYLSGQICCIGDFDRFPVYGAGIRTKTQKEGNLYISRSLASLA